MPVPLAGDTVCGLRKDNVELGMYFPVLTTSPVCPQSGDNYISNAELKGVDVKSIYMEKGSMEPNIGWDGTPYDWSKGSTEIQSNFVDTGAIGDLGTSNLLENSSFPTFNLDKWTSIYEEFDIGVKAENMLINTKMTTSRPWREWGTYANNSTSTLKMVTLSSTPPDTDLHTGFEVIKDVKAKPNYEIGYAQDNVPVRPNEYYTLSAWVKKKSKTYTKPMTFFLQMGNTVHRWVNKKIDMTKVEVGEWVRVSATFKTRNKESLTNFYLGVTYETYGHFEVCGATLVQGRLEKKWSPSPNDPYDATNHPSNWVYAKESPQDKTKVWADITEPRKIEPKYWSGKGWDNYYEMMKVKFGGDVKLIKQKSGNSIQIQKEHSGVVGLAQIVELQTPLKDLEFLTASFEMEEKSRSTGMTIRIEFYDNSMQFISSGKMSQRFGNINTEKRRFNATTQFRTIDGAKAKYVRVSFIGNQNKGRVNAAANKFKLEYGGRGTSWTLHRTEVGFNLDAGELKTPKIDGQVDKSHVIKEVAILRSSLGENLLSWEEVTRIKATTLKGATLHDYFVDNGGYYRYALQPIMLDGTKGAITGFYDVVTTLEGFWLLGQDDMQFSFIYDGKISGITHKKPIAIVETIASQYPYVVRSSDLDYRTYSFSGKLTHHQDKMNLLTSNTYTQAVSPQSTNPIGFVELKYGDEKRLECQNDLAEMQEGMVMQRIWRDKLLNWLKDGKPKILKSESEGNIMVMVSDVNVTPVQTVYGLVADLTCTMTEIGKVDEKTLQKFKLRKKEITQDDLRKTLLNEHYSY